MNKLLFLLFLPAAFLKCGLPEAKTAAVQRDLTITPGTAFSKLFLDSSALETFITDQEASDSAAKQLRDFYRGRNYQFAWFTDQGIAEHTRAFWNLHNNYINTFRDTAFTYKALHHQIEMLIIDSTRPLTAEAILQTELRLTKHFFEYSANAYSGKVDPQKLQWHIPRKKVNEVLLLDSLLARNGKDLEGWEPVNLYYQKLKKELLHYSAIDKNGGWKEISFAGGKTYRPGDSATQVKQVKWRLLRAGATKMIDTSAVYQTGFMEPVKRAQRSFGLRPDGVIDAALIRQLNVPVGTRIRQLLLNLERMRWVPEQPSGDLIIVNIPEFRLHVFDGEKKLFSIDIVVGKEAHNTVIFTGSVKYVVFSPYWNVPPSIVRREILPSIRKNGNYLARNHMEQTGIADGLPVIRQKPGGTNALGRVKFIFPNSYNIYFHDTPVKSLFEEDARAFSHGCIRLAEPQKLAAYLLRAQPGWTAQKMDAAMSLPVEKWVVLKNPVPVFITYFTAWVDSEGTLNFRDDIYGHDQKLAVQLFR